MIHFEGSNGGRTCEGVSRREFLRVGAISAGAVGLTLGQMAKAQSPDKDDVNCIVLFLVGGPSHLDTWDLKPAAPSHIRGPFQPIPTNVPGIDICEHFPRMAQRADRFALIRSVHHSASPIHETGQQLLQTGRLSSDDLEHPHLGSALAYLNGSKDSAVPSSVVLPRPIGNTGVSVGHGQTSGYLGSDYAPVVLRGDPARMASPRQLLSTVDQAQGHFENGNPGETAENAVLHQLFSTRAKKAFDLSAETDNLREQYGRNTFGQSCLLARRLVENGTRLVTVNMFDTVFNEVTWDCHADGGSLASSLTDYKTTLCPILDRAYSALLDDLSERGLLEKTLVVAMGEFGRTPILNPRGGRDHWPDCWSILMAGGDIEGGQVIGASDKTGSEPREQPVTASQVAATIYQSLGIDPALVMPATGKPLVEAEPIF